MLAHAGSPKALDVHGFSFDSVDRCFAALTAAAFVGLVAIVVWVWLSGLQVATSPQDRNCAKHEC